MAPGFHRRYAGRLAWRYRLLLASGLALPGLLHPPLALASLLALLLPARLFEGPALRAIARQTLAYPTALAYGEERLWAEVRKAPLALPSFPQGLLLLYLVLLLLVLVLAAWRAGTVGGSQAAPPGVERPADPRRGDGEAAPAGEPLDGGRGEALPGEAQPAPQGAEGELGAFPPPPGEGGEAVSPGAGEAQAPPSDLEAAPGEGVSRDGEPAPGPGGAGTPPGAGEEGTPGEGRTGGPGGEGVPEGPSPLPGGAGPPPLFGEGPALPPLPLPPGEGVGLLEPGAGEGLGELPAPWAGGQPPERVRRGVEVYLERTPLSPEARELLRRYFLEGGRP
ncbi:hypothetical protein [Thermus thermamylovorans]|uniref:hypothetical protein n=1 Tax=Thermus thermamylovorans TaxID=2509362 RepID=UPI0013755FFB|nr:hypothetical protein [Thermus thermamylovorans]